MPSTNGAPTPPATLGGQAVIEGVMIRGPKGTAVCVRNPDGEITCRTERVDGAQRLRRVPLARGVLALTDTISQGMRALIWSAQVAAGREPQEPSEAQVRVSTALSLGFMSAFLLVGPVAAGRRAERLTKRLAKYPRLAGAVEGFTRIGMLVGYLRTVGRLPQAQRLFAYHGAEHRAIQAYEAGAPLEVDSLRHFPNAHVRCGTSFLLTTTLVSSVVYGALGPSASGGLRRRILSRLVLLPVIAGLSYEAIRLASASSNALFRLLFRPNLAMQSLTTRDPDEGQMEVAVAAVRAALALHEGA